jgi:hypothetical protein
MASKMASKLSAFWQVRNSPLYTRISTREQENEAHSTHPSSLQPDEEEAFTTWSDFPIENNLESQSEENIHSITSSASSTPQLHFPTHRNLTFLLRCKLMLTAFPYRNMSYLVGVSFTIGSTIFILNGFFLLLPLLAPNTYRPTEAQYAVSVSSVLGTVLFLIGSWIAVLEALNVDRGEVLVTEGISLEPSTESIVKKGDGGARIQIQSRIDSSSSQVAEHRSQEREFLPQSSKSQAAFAATPAFLGSPTFIFYPTKQQLLTTYAS